MIEKRLNRLSTDPRTFDNAKHSYQVALHQSNFKHELECENKTNTVEKRYENEQKIMFFNPLYCQSVKTNIGKKVLDLIDKYFKYREHEKDF